LSLDWWPVLCNPYFDAEGGAHPALERRTLYVGRTDIAVLQVIANGQLAFADLGKPRKVCLR